MEGAHRHASTLVTRVNIVPQRNERVLESLENLHGLLFMEFQEHVGVIVEQLRLMHAGISIESKGKHRRLNIGKLRPNTDFCSHETLINQVGRQLTYLGVLTAHGKDELPKQSDNLFLGLQGS